MKKRSIIGNAFIYLFMTVVLIITLFPIIYVIASSFKTNSEILAYPERIFPINPTLDNYLTALHSTDFNLIRMFVNSVLYTLACVVISLFISSTAGYVFFFF